VHFLVIPKQHLEGCGAVTEENSAVVARVFEVIAKITAELGIDSYRVVTNKGLEAGQTVHHLHFHVLAGKVLGEMG
jgi:histidine triad (HIT) family protein